MLPLKRLFITAAALLLSSGLWANVSTLTFTAKCNGSGTADDGAQWTITSDASEAPYDTSKGIHYGTSSSAVGYIQLSTNAIHGVITQVKVNACSGSSIDYNRGITVQVGGTKFLCGGYEKSAMLTTPADATFTGSASGTVYVLISQTKAKIALYCKSIEVTYTADMVVHEGNSVTITQPRSIENLTIEKGGELVLGEDKLTVAGDLIIESAMGGGASGQLVGATDANLELLGDAYLDITLGDNGNPDKWHAFTVPFPVDAANGIFDTDGNRLTYGTHYAIMDYHGDLRADGLYGWKKQNGTLTPGTFYLVTVDGAHPTLRMKKSEGSLMAAPGKDFYFYTGAGTSADYGWNGIGNPTLRYGKVAYPVQVLDPVSYVYTVKLPNTCNFVVGTPFFYQAPADGSMTMLAADAGASYAPARTPEEAPRYLPVAFGNAAYSDCLYLSADTAARADYEIGKDLVKMTVTDRPSVPQIFGLAYGTKLCMVHAPWEDGQAAYALSLYAPQTADYTLSAPETENIRLYLTYEGQAIADISSGPYTLALQQGYNDAFGLLLCDAPVSGATDVKGLNCRETTARKILRGNRLLILRGDTLFDITGTVIR